MHPNPVTSSSRPDVADPHVERASHDEHYRGFDVAVAASRRVTGTILVNTALSGGPGRLKRFFCLQSSESDVRAACDAAASELRRVIDDLLAPA